MAIYKFSIFVICFACMILRSQGIEFNSLLPGSLKQRYLQDKVNYMFCSAEDPDCTSEFRLNDPDARCVNRTIIDVEDLRNFYYILQKQRDETWFIFSNTYYCVMVDESERLAALSGEYNETSTVTTNYTVLEFEPAVATKKNAIHLNFKNSVITISSILIGFW